MNAAQPSPAQRTPTFGDERDTVIAKCVEGGITWSVISQLDRQVIKVELPNGRRRTRSVYVTADLAGLYSALDFAEVVALGGYDAVLHRSSGVIEAHLDSDRGFGLRQLARIPEATLVRPTQGALFDFEEDDGGTMEDGSRRPGLGEAWAVLLSDADSPVAMEISPASPQIAVLGGRILPRPGYLGRPTLKVRGFHEIDHDSALKRLEDLSSAFFFELDLKRNIALRLSRARTQEGIIRTRFRRTQSAVVIPRKKYANDAVSLYTYGRLATGMPLLQFLAYYQCIEYFFPHYWNAELIGRVRRMINDPRFDPDQDADIGRLLGIGATRGRSGAAEREQLRTTIDACVDVADVEEFLGEDEPRRDALLAKNRLQGVTPLAPKDRNNRLTHQVAARIYELRCRVVHAKEDGGEPGVAEVLLPFSAEADLIGPDVDLARFVAQKTIIAGRRGDQW